MKNLIIRLLDKAKDKLNDIELEKQELSGNIIVNKEEILNLSETFDITRIRYDYGIKLPNDSLVKVKSKFLEIDKEGNLYYLINDDSNEREIVGKVEDCLYEYDLFYEEWNKADLVRILGSTNFVIKCSKLKEIKREILENKGMELYEDINKNRIYGGLSLYE